MITAAMGGVLAEQADPTVFRRVLDVAVDRWLGLSKVAQTVQRCRCRHQKRMIEYARAQAQAYQVNGRVEFHVMDAIQVLDFPAAADLVNLRLASAFVRIWDGRKC